MSFETFAVAVVCLLIGYAIGKIRAEESFIKGKLAQALPLVLQSRVEREVELRSGEVKDRVEQELQSRVDREIKRRSAELDKRLDQEFQRRWDRENKRLSREMERAVELEQRSRVIRELLNRSDEVEKRVEQELQSRVECEVKLRSAEVKERVEQELKNRVEREVKHRSGEVGERVEQELQNRVSRKVKERSVELEKIGDQELQSRVDREVKRCSGEVGERVEQELQNRDSRKVKERSAEVEKKGDQELQSRVDREVQRRSGEVEERVEQELQNRSSREFKEGLEQIKEALEAMSVWADLSSQQQSEASNTSEDSDVVEFDPHAPLKQKGTRNGVPYFNRTLTDDEAREYASRGDFYYFADNKSSEGHLFVGKYLAAVRYYQDIDDQGQLVEKEYVARAFWGMHPACYALLLFLQMERGTNIDSYPVPKDARDWSGWDWCVQISEIISLPMRKAWSEAGCDVHPYHKWTQDVVKYLVSKGYEWSGSPEEKPKRKLLSFGEQTNDRLFNVPEWVRDQIEDNDDSVPIAQSSFIDLKGSARKLLDLGLLREKDLKANWERYLEILEQNGVTTLYHFTATRNLPQIKKMGGLISWKDAEDQKIEVEVFGGDSFSRELDSKYGNASFVHLSFCPDHPMSYRLKDTDGGLVWLQINPIVAVFRESLFSDINAAARGHHQGASLQDLKRINFEATKQRYLSRNSEFFKQHQAEVMVKHRVPVQFILNLDELLAQHSDFLEE